MYFIFNTQMFRCCILLNINANEAQTQIYFIQNVLTPASVGKHVNQTRL